MKKPTATPLSLPTRAAFRMRLIVEELLCEEGVRLGDTKSQRFRDTATTVCGSLACCLGKLVSECAPKGELDEALEVVCAMVQDAASGADDDQEELAP